MIMVDAGLVGWPRPHDALQRGQTYLKSTVHPPVAISCVGFFGQRGSTADVGAYCLAWSSVGVERCLSGRPRLGLCSGYDPRGPVRPQGLTLRRSWEKHAPVSECRRSFRTAIVRLSPATGCVAGRMDSLIELFLLGRRTDVVGENRT